MKSKISPPLFSVGPNAVSTILDLLESDPLASNEKLAESLGADPAHPFFITDVIYARLLVSGLTDEMDALIKLQKEQTANVALSITYNFLHSIGGSVSSKDIEIYLKIRQAIEQHQLFYAQEVIFRVLKITKMIEIWNEFAGDKSTNMENILRTFLADNGLDGDQDELENKWREKVFSVASNKNDTNNASRTPEEPEEVNNGRY